MAEPKIRFPKFADDWKQYKIGEVGSFYYGRSCPKWSVTEDATIPCVRYGELYTKFGSKIDKVYSYTNIQADKLRFSKGTEVLIPRVGEDPMDYNHCTWLSISNVAIGEMISVYNTKQNPLFTAMMFNATLRNEFAVRVEGFSVTNLYFEELKNITVYYPCLEEQQKIADFLSTVDKVISQSEAEVRNLEQQKKAAMQKIFSQEVRFKREDGTEFPKWEEKKFGTIMSCYSGGTPSSKNKQYYNGSIPFIRSGEIHSSKTELFLSDEGLNNSAAKMVAIGDLIYALYGATSGEVDISKINGAINQAILCIVPYSDNRLYLKFWLECFKTEITSRLLQGGQGNLSAELIKNLIICLPHIEEQQKIADFLSNYDEAITYAKQELEKWKELKKGLLQQMFV